MARRPSCQPHGTRHQAEVPEVFPGAALVKGQIHRAEVFVRIRRSRILVRRNQTPRNLISILVASELPPILPMA